MANQRTTGNRSVARALAGAAALYTAGGNRLSNGLSSILQRSAYLLRRFAALNKTSLAHVDVSLPAAASSSARWASVSLIRNSAALRSSGALGGRPIFDCFSIKENVATKNILSTIAGDTFCCYNKSSGNKKTPVKPWRVSPGQNNPAGRRIV
jgi:hypothetical protein